MKLWQLAITLIVLIVLREVSGDLLMRLTGLAALANFGGLAIGSFFSGWLAGAISKLGPSDGQRWSLAAARCHRSDRDWFHAGCELSGGGRGIHAPDQHTTLVRLPPLRCLCRRAPHEDPPTAFS